MSKPTTTNEKRERLRNQTGREKAARVARATATHYRVNPRADGSFLLKPLAMISERELRRLRGRGR
jgi:hypothetical protein